MLDIQIPASFNPSITMWKRNHESPDSKSEQSSTCPSSRGEDDRVSRATNLSTGAMTSGVATYTAPSSTLNNSDTLSSILANGHSQSRPYQATDPHIANLTNNIFASQIYALSQQGGGGGGAQHQLMTSSLYPNSILNSYLGGTTNATGLQLHNAAAINAAGELTGGSSTKRIEPQNSNGIDITPTTNGDTEGNRRQDHHCFEHLASDGTGTNNGLFKSSEETAGVQQTREYLLNNFLPSTTTTRRLSSSASSQLSTRLQQGDLGSTVATADKEEFARRRNASMNSRRELQQLMLKQNSMSTPCKHNSDNKLHNNVAISSEANGNATSTAAGASMTSLSQLENATTGVTASLVSMKRSAAPTEDDGIDGVPPLKANLTTSHDRNLGVPPINKASLNQMDSFASAGQPSNLQWANSSSTNHQNKKRRTDSSDGGEQDIPLNSTGIPAAVPHSPQLQLSPATAAGGLVLTNGPLVPGPYGGLVAAAPHANLINRQYWNQILLSQQQGFSNPGILLPQGISGAAATVHHQVTANRNRFRTMGRPGQFLVTTAAPIGAISSSTPNILFPPTGFSMQHQQPSATSSSSISGRSPSIVGEADLPTNQPIPGNNQESLRPVEAPSSGCKSRTKIGRERRTREGNILTLKTPSDVIWLSQFLCFLREECCEVYKANAQDVKERRKTKQIELNQVGIRCRFCAHLPHNERTGRSSCFPSSIDRIYQSVTMMIREHFSICEEFPPEIRQKYVALKQNTRKGEMESKTHWRNAAREVGMMDVKNDESGKKKGIFFREDT